MSQHQFEEMLKTLATNEEVEQYKIRRQKLFDEYNRWVAERISNSNKYVGG